MPSHEQNNGIPDPEMEHVFFPKVEVSSNWLLLVQHAFVQLEFLCFSPQRLFFDYEQLPKHYLASQTQLGPRGSCASPMPTPAEEIQVTRLVL